MSSFLHVLLLSSLLLAAASSSQAKVESGLLSSSDVDVSDFPAPPAEGSLEDETDLNLVRFRQKERTDDLCKIADEQAHMNLNFIFGSPRGPLTDVEIDQVRDLMAQVAADAGYFNLILKKKYNRPRPFMRDSEITACVTHSPEASYPSGHSVVSRLMGLILSDLYPSKKKAILEQTDSIADSRVLGGVHHPKDTEAGQQLGNLIFKAYLKNNFYKKCEADISVCNSIGQAKVKDANY